MGQPKKQTKEIKRSFIGQYFQHLIHFRIVFEQDHITFNSIFIFATKTIQTLQQLGMLLAIYADSNQSMVGVQIIQYLSELVRPYHLFEHPNDFEELAYLIPFFIILISQLGMFILIAHFFITKQENTNLSDYVWQSNNKILLLLSYIYAYTSVLFMQILALPFIEMTLQAIRIEFNNQGGIINLVFAFITLLFIIYVALFELVVAGESLSIMCINFQVLKQTFAITQDFLIILCLSFTNVFITNSDTKQYIICPLLIIGSTSLIFNVAMNYSTSHEINIQIIHLNVLQITITVVILFNLLIGYNSSQEIIISLLIYPILDYIIISIYTSIHCKAILPSIGRDQPKIVQYRIFHIMKYFPQKSCPGIINAQNSIYFMMYKLDHEKYCENIHCKCHNTSCMMVSNDYDFLIQCYLLDEMNAFYITLQKGKNQTKYSYFLHYLSLINLLGNKSRALQLSNNQIHSEHEASQHSLFRHKSVDVGIEASQISDKNDAKSSSDRKTKTNAPAMINFKLTNMNYIQKQQLYILQEIIKQQMNSELLLSGDNRQNNLQYAVKLFLESEDSNTKIKSKIIKMMIKKKDYFGRLLKQQNASQLFIESKKLAISLGKLEQLLQKMYEQFPSQKIQALNSFFSAEILNNYYQAYKITNITSVSDEKLLKMHTTSTFDLFSNSIDYLLVGFEQQGHRLQIRGNSNQAYKFFSLKQDQFKKLQSINLLLPQNFETIHQKLVNEFLTSGESKYFKQINLNFCRTAHRMIKPINLFFDVNLKNLDELSFAVFLQNYEHESAFIFVGQNKKIGGITKNLVNKLGYSSKCAVQFNNICLKKHIERVFPHFQDYIDGIVELNNDQSLQTLSQYNALMKAPKENCLIKDTQFLWEQQHQINNFQADIQVQLRKVENRLDYAIIEIKQIKHTEMSMTQINKTYYETDNSCLSPFRTQKLLQAENTWMDFEDFQINNISVEEAVEPPKVIQKAEHVNNIDSFNQFGSRFVILDKKVNEQSYQQVELISPKDPHSNLLVQLKQKQQFFSKNQQQLEISSDDNINSQTDNDPIDNNQFNDDMDKELRDNLKMQMQIDQANEARIVHIDDIGSQVSSIAGLKTSKYFKKYELIQRMITTTKFSRNCKIMLLILIVANLIVIFQSSLFIQITQTDLERFQQELDMVQIKVNIMGPIDKFVVALATQLEYFWMLIVLQMITPQDANTRRYYSSLEVQNSYNQLKDSLHNQLTNPYLQPFFQDKYIVVNQSNYPGLTQYNITIREALNLYMESFFMLLTLDFSKVLILDTSVPFLVYSLSNYATFTDLFQSITSEILLHSIDRALEVQQKWYAFWIPIVIVNTILIFIAYSYYHQYIGEYCSILTLFKYVDVFWLNKDIDRYKIFIDLLQKDENVLFGYRFDINLKEKLLEIEEKKQQEFDLKNNSKQKQKLGSGGKPFILPSLKSIGVFGFVFIVYIAISAIQNLMGQQYFQKYSATTNLFNQIADLSLASSGMFAMRQLCYQIQYPYRQVYYFMDPNNANYFLNKFDEHIELVGEMLVELDQLKHDDYLVTETFFNQLNDVMTQDICQYLPEDKIELAQPHCDKVYHGVLRRGYQLALVSIRDSLVNEKISTNNFLLQVYTNNEELEAGLIGSDVMNMLKETFQSELKYYTSQLITSIIMISIIYGVFFSLLTLILITIIMQYYKAEFIIVNRFVLLLPQTSLFIDTYLDRKIRQIIVKGQLI